MNWTIVGWIGVLVAIVVIRSVARRWVAARWLADEISDRQAKWLFFATAFGPMLAAGAWLAMISPFPRGLIILAIFSLALAPAVGLGAATLDYASEYGVKQHLRGQQNEREL